MISYCKTEVFQPMTKHFLFEVKVVATTHDSTYDTFLVIVQRYSQQFKFQSCRNRFTACWVLTSTSGYGVNKIERIFSVYSLGGLSSLNELIFNDK